MKQSPREQNLEAMLRSSKLVAGGFMGDDTRRVSEIIESDLRTLALVGRSAKEVADRMAQITAQAIAGLGTWVQIDPERQSRVDEAKGSLVCPWPHAGRFAKRVTILKLKASGESIRWSDLNIHMIAEHGFFEGKGSHFRIEPKQLIEFIF